MIPVKTKQNKLSRPLQEEFLTWIILMTQAAFTEAPQTAINCDAEIQQSGSDLKQKGL